MIPQKAPKKKQRNDESSNEEERETQTNELGPDPKRFATPKNQVPKKAMKKVKETTPGFVWKGTPYRAAELQ